MKLERRWPHPVRWLSWRSMAPRAAATPPIHLDRRAPGATATRARSSGGAARAVLLGGLAVAALDITYAIVSWQLKAGVGPARILRSVAAGVLGAQAATGGAATAVLGAALHLGIALTMAATYYAASTRWPALIRRPLWWGACYGLALYGVMNYVVLPLSAARAPLPAASPWTLCSVVAHMVLVGVPCALAARRAISSPGRAPADGGPHTIQSAP
jgi:hypothetical protein